MMPDDIDYTENEAYQVELGKVDRQRRGILREVLASMTLPPGPLFNYRLEWDLLGEPAIPGMTHMTQEFLDEKKYRETKDLLEMAAERGMCENITAFYRTVVVSEWMEGEP